MKREYQTAQLLAGRLGELRRMISDGGSSDALEQTRRQIDAGFQQIEADVEALRASMGACEAYRRLFERASEACLHISGADRVIEANAAAASLLQRPADELAGCALSDCFSPGPLDAMIASSQMEPAAVQIKTPDGELNVTARLEPLSGALDGGIPGEAEALLWLQPAALPRSAISSSATAWLRSLVETLPSGAMMIDPDGKVLIVNQTARRILGETRQQIEEGLRGRYQFETSSGVRLSPQDHPVMRAMRQGIPVDDYRMRVHRGWGDDLLILTSASPVYHPDGTLAGAVTVFDDVTFHEALVGENRRQHEVQDLLFDLMPNGLAVVSGDPPRFLTANPAYRRMLPNPNLDPVGQDYSKVWGISQDPVSLQHVRQVLATGEPVNHSYSSRRFPDGSTHIFAYDIRRLPVEGEPTALIVLREMTEMESARRSAEAAAQTAHRRAAELSMVITSIPEAVVIYDAVGRVAQANQAMQNILGFNPLGMNPPDVAKAASMGFIGGVEMTEGAMPTEHALKGETVRGVMMQITSQAGQEHILSVSSSPIYLNGSLMGAVTIWRDETEVYRRRSEMEALAGIASALRTALTLEDMLPAVLDQVQRLFNTVGAVIAIGLTPADQKIRLGSGVWSGREGETLPGDGVTARVIETGQPYLNNSLSGDTPEEVLYFSPEMTSAACVPLTARGQYVGVIWLGKTSRFLPDDQGLMIAIADIAANAIHRARLFDQTQLRLNRLSVLHNIDMAITSSLDLQITLDVLLDQTFTHMGADAASILLFNPDLQSLEYAAGRGFLTEDAVMRAIQLRIGESLAGQVALERAMRAYPDTHMANLGTPDGALEVSPSDRFMAYFGVPLIAKGQLKGVLELFKREPMHPDPEWLDFMQTLATQAAIAIDNAELFNRLQRSNDDLMLAYDATIEGWSRALELRDQETHGHSERVTSMAMKLARRMGFRDPEIGPFRRGVLLHDIGKMAIPDNILLKPGQLTPDEWTVMRKHPTYAHELLSPIPSLRQSLDVPYCHHEWWDGSGYPRGLKGEEIPLSARLFAVVDVWDALTSDRPYREAWTAPRVRDYILELKGKQFDPRVVDEFFSLLYNREGGKLRT